MTLDIYTIFIGGLSIGDFKKSSKLLLRKLLLISYYIKITFLVSYVSFKVIKKGNQHIVDYLLDYLFKLVKREKLTTLHFQWLCELSDTGDERIELPPKVLETPIIPFDQSPTLDIPSKPHTLYIYHSISVNTTIQVKPSTD